MLRERLNEALRTATEADDRCAMAIVRLIHAALKERDQQARADGQPQGLSDDDLMGMLEAMVAQRCDSIRRYEASGQLELADHGTGRAQPLAEKRRTVGEHEGGPGAAAVGRVHGRSGS